MAKQTVSFVERHLEKFVIAPVALLTIAIGFLYIITGPNTAEINRAPVSPGSVDGKIRDMAANAFRRLQSAGPEPLSELPDVATIRETNPLRIDNSLQPRYALADVPPSMKPREVELGRRGGRVELATILAPTAPRVSQGRGQATGVATAFIEAVQQGAAVPGVSDLTLGNAAQDRIADVTWVTVAALLSRKAQQQQFRDAGYTFGRDGFYLTGIRLQRRMLQRDGTWSEPQLVPTFVPGQVPQQPAVRLDDSLGRPQLPEAQRDVIRDYFKKITDPAMQAAIWRPPLAPYLVTSDPKWSPPQIEGVTWEFWTRQEEPRRFGGFGRERTGREEAPGLSPFGRPRPGTGREEPGYSRRPLGGYEGPGGIGAGARARDRDEDRARLARQRLLGDIRDAEKALENEDYETARRLAERVVQSSDATRGLQKSAEDVLEKIRQAEEAAAEKLERAVPAEIDLEPIWVHDLSAEPGRTYQYRIQVLAYNNYVGAPAEVKNPADAEAVTVASAWDENPWSDPIAVEPDTYFFFTRGNKRDQTASIEVYQYRGGAWQRVYRKFAVGKRVAYEDIDTGMTVIDLDVDARRVVPTESHARDREYEVGEQQVEVLLLADANGNLEERISEIDKDSPLRTELRRAAREERRR
jgi:hypothetical protein